ncbi:MAG: SusC/RagA family TonB-linked outer membrane protein [Marinilabiliaceae bacterium]|nr:SusC/RagA family TonB-linked outer membrane protein [Marinilabiliaceae bacterium]
MKKLIINACFVLFAMLCIARVDIHAQESTDSIVNVAFGTKARQDVLGAVSTVNIAELLKKNYQTNSLSGINSFVGGITGGLWGKSNQLILVDGVPTINDLNASDVESVTILKGANAVVLYGSLASNGVILITTKRGKEQPFTVEARANTGIFIPKSYPKYLDAASYMTLYNEASDNDGIARIYDDATIYNTASGVNPYKYPDINYFSSDYLKEFCNRSDATIEISGGDEKTKYYTNFGIQYDNDIINYGEQSKNHDLNFRIRSNVDMKLTNWLSAQTNVGVLFNNNYTGRGDFWGNSATIRPNWYSTLIPVNMLDPDNVELQSIVETSNHIVDGQYLLGGNNAVQTNAFADMLEAGYIRYKDRTFQFKVSATADLAGITKGLSFTNAFSLSYDNFFSEAYKLDYATYEPTWSNMNGKEMIIGLKKYGNDDSSTNEYVGDSKYKQTLSFYSQFNYARTFQGLHNVSGNIIGWGFQYRQSVDESHNGSDYHSTSNANLGLQAAYNFAHKYYFDFSGAIVHSAKLPENNRTAFSPTVTLGWRISDENFMKGLSFIDDIKFTASYANLHHDVDISDYYLYQGYYDDDGWYQWRDGAMGGKTVLSHRSSNPDLTFITEEQFRVGLEGIVLNKKIAFDINYFNNVSNGLLTQGRNTLYPSYFTGAGSSYLPYINFNQNKRSGIDFSVLFNNKLGDLEYKIGFVGMVYDSKATVRDELYQDNYQNRVGKPITAAFGYICDGFFANQTDIDNHEEQKLSDVKPGDMKYRDMNNDNIIDSRDQVMLGKYESPFTYGVNLTLKYKNWTLFAMGDGKSGGINFKNSSYYWVYGSRKYSETVLGRWTPSTASTATYPRLTTTSNSNNFQNSTFWQYENNRFDLRTIQLTYDFPKTLFNENSLLSQLSIYVSGYNLLTISKEREMMEMNIGSAPQYRYYNLGLKATF